MTPIAEIISHQIDMNEQREAQIRKQQDECEHRFIITTQIDAENDRLLDVSFCSRCNLESF